MGRLDRTNQKGLLLEAVAEQLRHGRLDEAHGALHSALDMCGARQPCAHDADMHGFLGLVLHAELLALQGLPGPAASYLHRALESSEVLFGKRRAPPNAAALVGGREGWAASAGCFGACCSSCLGCLELLLTPIGIGDDTSRQLLSEKLGSMAAAVRASGTAKTVPGAKKNHIIK